MADEKKFDQKNPSNEPKDFEVEELNDEALEGVAGGLQSVDSERDTNNGCTVNNVAHC